MSLFTIIITIHCYSSDYLGNQLYDASYDHRLKDVKRLLAKGAPVNWRNSYGWTALHAACFNNRVNVIKILTSQDNIDVNKQTNNNNTPLHWACRYSHLKCVEILCATGQCDLGMSVCMSCDTL